jgi:hypothetical protein
MTKFLIILNNKPIDNTFLINIVIDNKIFSPILRLVTSIGEST